MLEKRLGEVEYLAGDYSIADMTTYVWLRNPKHQDQTLDDYPNVKRWFDAIACAARSAARAQEGRGGRQELHGDEEGKLAMDDRSSSVGILVIGLILGWMGINPAAHAADAYQPDPKLVEAAQEGRQVLLYTTQIVDQIVRPLIKSFQSYVPGVDVKYVRADGLALDGAHDQRGPRRPCPVGSSGSWSTASAPSCKNGFAAQFEVPSAKGLPSTLVDPKGCWIATNLGVRSAAYNTQLVPKEVAPHSYQDLLDPRWKGKMVWNPKSMTGAWGFISTVIKGMGEEQGMTYLRALAKQDIVPLPIAIRAVLDRVIGGEYAIGLEMNNTHAAISAAQGAPVQWVPLNPVSETIQVGRHHQGRAASERGPVVHRLHGLTRRPGDFPRQRLLADAPGCQRQDSGAAA